MTQTMTGPRGMIAWHRGKAGAAAFPALDLPCRSFAARRHAAHNGNHAPSVIFIPRHLKAAQATAIFGTPPQRRQPLRLVQS